MKGWQISCNIASKDQQGPDSLYLHEKDAINLLAGYLQAGEKNISVEIFITHM